MRRFLPPEYPARSGDVQEEFVSLDKAGALQLVEECAGARDKDRVVTVAADVTNASGFLRNLDACGERPRGSRPLRSASSSRRLMVRLTETRLSRKGIGSRLRSYFMARTRPRVFRRRRPIMEPASPKR